MSDRPGRVALLDWDHALHPGFTLGPWLRALARDAQEAAVAERFWDAQARYLGGLLAYDAFVDIARAAYTTLAAGRSRRDLTLLAADLVPRLPLRPGATEFVAALRAAGIRPVVISGAPIEVLRAHAQGLGIDGSDVTGWTLAWDGERAVGRLVEDTAKADAKHAGVERLRAEGHAFVLGLGDSAADRPLVEAARIGAWVDPHATGESRRVRWVDRATGTAGTGSLDDLGAVIRALPPGDPPGTVAPA